MATLHYAFVFKWPEQKENCARYGEKDEEGRDALFLEESSPILGRF